MTKLRTVNVKDVEEDVWLHFVAQAKIQKTNVGVLLTHILQHYLNQEASER